MAWTRITAAATSGVGPDLTQLGTTWVGAVNAMGALVPWPLYVKENGAAYEEVWQGEEVLEGRALLHGLPRPKAHPQAERPLVPGFPLLLSRYPATGLFLPPERPFQRFLGVPA
ncbi:hypothetical protein YIM1640_19400 [Thermus oshimai]